MDFLHVWNCAALKFALAYFNEPELVLQQVSSFPRTPTLAASTDSDSTDLKQ